MYLQCIEMHEMCANVEFSFFNGLCFYQFVHSSCLCLLAIVFHDVLFTEQLECKFIIYSAQLCEYSMYNNQDLASYSDDAFVRRKTQHVTPTTYSNPDAFQQATPKSILTKHFSHVRKNANNYHQHHHHGPAAKRAFSLNSVKPKVAIVIYLLEAVAVVLGMLYINKCVCVS